VNLNVGPIFWSGRRKGKKEGDVWGKGGGGEEGRKRDSFVILFMVDVDAHSLGTRLGVCVRKGRKEGEKKKKGWARRKGKKEDPR